MYGQVVQTIADYSLVEQMKDNVGITEELKASDQMKWDRLMKKVRNAAEEVVVREWIELQEQE